MGNHYDKHCVGRDKADIIAGYAEMYAWVIKDAKKYQNPIPYDHRMGAVTWVRVPTSLCPDAVLNEAAVSADETPDRKKPRMLSVRGLQRTDSSASAGSEPSTGRATSPFGAGVFAGLKKSNSLVTIPKSID